MLITMKRQKNLAAGSPVPRHSQARHGNVSVAATDRTYKRLGSRNKRQRKKHVWHTKQILLNVLTTENTQTSHLQPSYDKKTKRRETDRGTDKKDPPADKQFLMG